jgi:hypothetical protein
MHQDAGEVRKDAEGGAGFLAPGGTTGGIVADVVVLGGAPGPSGPIPVGNLNEAAFRAAGPERRRYYVRD